MLAAFARVLAGHGYAGATIASIAAEAGVAPGLVHHHFSGTTAQGLLGLVSRFRQRVRRYGTGETGSSPKISTALKLTTTPTSSRRGAGSASSPSRAKIRTVRACAASSTPRSRQFRDGRGTLSDPDAGCVLAFVIGSLVMGRSRRETAASRLRTPAVRRGGAKQLAVVNRWTRTAVAQRRSRNQAMRSNRRSKHFFADGAHPLRRCPI
jgi:AcrR family transcriptional regulator